MTITTINARTGARTVSQEDAPSFPQRELTLQEIEADVQAIAEQITVGNDRDVAMAMATVDLVMAAVNGNLAGLTKAQVRAAYRERVVDILHTRRGVGV